MLPWLTIIITIPYNFFLLSTDVRGPAHILTPQKYVDEHSPSKHISVSDELKYHVDCYCFIVKRIKSIVNGTNDDFTLSISYVHPHFMDETNQDKFK